jgi:hypothetical protein
MPGARRVGFTLLLTLHGGGVLAAPLLDLHPADRFSTSAVGIEYLRPWAGLPVQRGRVALRLPAIGELRLGLDCAGMQAPTVSEFELATSVQISERIHGAIGRNQVKVDGLVTEERTGAHLALRWREGAWEMGVSGELEWAGTGLVQRRVLWLGLESKAGDLALSRRTTPWSSDPRWGAIVRLRLGPGFGLGLVWNGAESALLLELSPAPYRLTSLAIWTGPRVGGVGFRLETSP